MLQTGNETTPRWFACSPASSKSRLPKHDYLHGIKHVSLLGTFTVFLQQNFINGCHTCILLRKLFTIFLRDLSCHSSYCRWKLGGLFFFFSFPGGNEKFACACAPMYAHLQPHSQHLRTRTARLEASPLDFALQTVGKLSHRSFSES